MSYNYNIHLYDFIYKLCICNSFQVAPLMVYQVTEKSRGRVALDSFAHQMGFAQVTIVKTYVKLLIDIMFLIMNQKLTIFYDHVMSSECINSSGCKDSTKSFCLSGVCMGKFSV